MTMRRVAQGGSGTGLLMAIAHALTTFEGLREGALIVEETLDNYQRALDDVCERNALLERPGVEYMVSDMSEDDWETWDCCRARIDATVETCRNLGYEAVRDIDGFWKLGYGSWS